MSEETKSTPESGMTKPPEQPGTTSVLFPEFVKTEPPVPQPEGEVAKSPEPPVEEPQKPDVGKTLEEFLSEELFDKKLKTKVDGQEMVVSLRDVIKGYQTDQHLTKKGQKLAAKEAEIEEKLQQALRTALEKPTEKPAVSDEEDPFVELVKPHIAPLLGELKTVKDQLNVLASLVEPMKYQENLKRVDSQLRTRGYEDFMQYVPRIEGKITEVASADMEEANRLNTPQGYIELFYDLKLQDLSTRSSPPPAPPSPPTPPGQPKVTVVEGSTGVGTGSDDWLVQYNVAKERAIQTGDWSEVLRLKGVL